VELHLAGGKYDDSLQLFSPAVLRERWPPQTILPVPGPYAYFGMTGTDRVTQYAAIRKQQLADAKHLTDSIGKEVAAFQAQQTATVSGRHGAPPLAAKDLSVYMGTYRDPWLGEIVISMKNGKPWFDSKRSPKATGELLPYNGIESPPRQLDDVTTYPPVTRKLIKRGYQPADIGKILGGNFIRVLKANEVFTLSK